MVHNMEHEDLFAKYGGTEAQLLTIDLMEGHDFEYWCAGLLRKIGFTHVEVTPGSNDQGVDILAQKDGVKYAIQCKRYSHDLGNTPVQEVHAGKAMYNCHVSVVMTNQHFTKGAKDLAQATGVLLWDREWIRRNLETSGSILASAPATESSEDLFPAAVELVLTANQASIPLIQRELSIGYARAARLIDEMEEKGIVGPFQGSKPRTVLITKKDWEARIGRTQKPATSPELDPAPDCRQNTVLVEFPEPPPPAMSRHLAPLLCFLSMCIPFLKVCLERGFLSGEPAEIIADILCTIVIPLLITYLCIFKNPQGRFYQKWWFWLPLFLVSFFVK